MARQIGPTSYGGLPDSALPDRLAESPFRRGRNRPTAIVPAWDGG